MSNNLMAIGQDVKTELTKSSVAMPVNYNFFNALKAAHLILKETVDKQKRPALDVCSKDSIHTAILDMAIQGLNPLKKQCYFVVYGNKLQMIRSYMGAQMVAKYVDPRITSIRAEIVYQGDNIKLSIKNGQKCIENHEQTMESISKCEVIAAYAMAIDADENVLLCDLMTIDEIKQAWKQSKVNPVTVSGVIDKSSTHGKFTGEMARRTVINRLCKWIINTSDDQTLIAASMRTDEESPVEMRVQQEIKENANQKLIDLPVAPPQDQEEAEEILQPEVKMCSRAIADQIKANEKKLGRDAEGFFKKVSGMLGKEIKKCSDMTEDEAQMYYDMQLMDIQELDNQKNQEQEEPPWA